MIKSVPHESGIPAAFYDQSSYKYHEQHCSKAQAPPIFTHYAFPTIQAIAAGHSVYLVFISSCNQTEINVTFVPPDLDELGLGGLV